MTKIFRIPDWLTALRGGLIYASGDTIATLISGEYQPFRAIGMLAVGATLYATEIPSYFRWIDRLCTNADRWNPLMRAILAQLFFNPLWIARHLLFIRFFAGRWSDISWQLLAIGLESFLHIVPVGLLMNYLIQNRIASQWRFLASALYSAVMAIYFALSEVWFG